MYIVENSSFTIANVSVLPYNRPCDLMEDLGLPRQSILDS